MVLKHIPPAPKYREEIKEIIDEGRCLPFGAAWSLKLTAARTTKTSWRRPMSTRRVLWNPTSWQASPPRCTSPARADDLFSKLFINDKYDQTGSHIVGYADHGSGGYILRVRSRSWASPSAPRSRSCNTVLRFTFPCHSITTSKWIQSPFF